MEKYSILRSQLTAEVQALHDIDSPGIKTVAYSVPQIVESHANNTMPVVFDATHLHTYAKDPAEKQVTESPDLHYISMENLNENPVAGSGGTVTEAVLATVLPGNVGESLTSKSVSVDLNTLVQVDDNCHSPASEITDGDNTPIPKAAEDSLDGLCTVQLMTHSMVDGSQSIKLVTVTDAILISVHFKCQVCKKVFLSANELTQHSWSHKAASQAAQSSDLQKGGQTGEISPRPDTTTCSLSSESRFQIQGMMDGIETPQCSSDSNQITAVDVRDETLIKSLHLESTDVIKFFNDVKSAVGKERMCFICRKMFQATHMWKHFSEMHMQGEERQCFVCGKKLASDREFLQHMMHFHTSFRDVAIFCCALCEKRFNSHAFLLNHMLLAHSADERDSGNSLAAWSAQAKETSPAEKRKKTACVQCEGSGFVPFKKYSCQICSDAFADTRQLQRHMSEHTERTLCTVCHKLIFLKSFPKHMTIHTKSREFECPTCKKCYRLKCDLTKHLRTHTDEKPYVCGICQMSFKHSSQLPRHLRAHSGEKPYQCDICAKMFSRKFGLQEHMFTHNANKKYHCSICSKSFPNATRLKKHNLKHPMQESQTRE